MIEGRLNAKRPRPVEQSVPLVDDHRWLIDGELVEVALREVARLEAMPAEVALAEVVLVEVERVEVVLVEVEPVGSQQKKCFAAPTIRYVRAVLWLMRSDVVVAVLLRANRELRCVLVHHHRHHHQVAGTRSAAERKRK